ncbi:hypothetical protein SteCoe_16082 [Stentor coeruleus]|uniref:Uncharacterized protein n=1 Tax=Stentor coeruleus TaxID=5963 RepID=A0A1R2C244_9CILI|nr:hypothetical protein SteCoe_16082 [Stentor coeruleus]
MNILFGKRKSAKELPKRTQTLNSAFAQEVLYLEEQVNMNCTLPVVTRLIELYTKAIEIYEAEKNLKHIHYQERMQSLLSRTNVIQLFKQNSGHVPQRKLSINTSPICQNDLIPKAETPKAMTLVSPKAVAFKAKLQTIPELQVERNCEQVIKEHTQESSNISRKIQDNLKNQSESLRQRLMFRKQATTPRYGKSCFVFEEHSQSDISAGEAKSNPVEEFENELEAIMEKYVEEKTKIKNLIKEKYQEYFDETKTIKGEVREKLIQELTKNMNIEIFETLSEIDKLRNEEIATARKKLHQNPLF